MTKKSKSSRIHNNPVNKFNVVMREYKQHTLHSGNGKIVKNQKQAIAIAYSEQRRYSKKR
jgi:hypothetical protein